MKSNISGFLKKKNGSAGTPSLDNMLELFDRELNNFSSLVEPSPESKPRTNFDSPDLPIEVNSRVNMTKRQLFGAFPIMLPIIINMRKGSKLYGGKFTPSRSEASPGFIENLESLAKKLGPKI
jgi:hypothetical protein